MTASARPLTALSEGCSEPDDLSIVTGSERPDSQVAS